jgi:hypothetical protein
MNFKGIALATAVALSPLAIHAQGNIQQHKMNQQDRIAQGVRSGQLTSRETSHLERQEAAVNREERSMRAQNNGRLTRQDRSTLRAQQNQESRRIFRDKHNRRAR